MNWEKITVFSAFLLILSGFAVADGVEIHKGVQINQPGNDAEINSSGTFNVSNIELKQSKTILDGVNFTISHSTTNLVNVWLSYFEGSAGTEKKVADFDASGSDNVTFQFDGLYGDSIYQSFKNGSEIKREKTTSSGYYQFYNSVWSGSNESFKLKNIDNFLPQISSPTYISDKVNSYQRLQLDIDDKGESDIKSVTGLSNLVSFTNQSVKASISLPYTNSIYVTDFEPENSNTISLDIDENDTGVKMYEQFNSNFSEQRITRLTNVSSSGRSVLANVSHDPSRGTVVQGTSWSRTVSSGTVESFRSIWKGDWLEQESNSSVSYSSGTLRIGQAVGTQYTAVQDISAKNNRSDSVSLTVDASSYIANKPGCSLVNSSELTFDPGTVQTKTVHHNCDPGYEIDYSPVTRVELANKYEYTYEADVHVNNDIASEQDQKYCIPESRLDDWDSRVPDEYKLSVDGDSDDLSFNERSLSGSEYVCITIGDQHTNSSWHQGDHNVTMKYYVSKDTQQTSSGGGSGGGSFAPKQKKVIKNVTGEFDWTVSALGSTDTDFQFFGHPGENESVPIALENTGDRPVNLTLQCVGGGSVCDNVHIPTKRVEFNSNNFTEAVVMVEWSVPENYDKKQMNFRVRVTDPSWEPGMTEGVAYVDFKVDTGSPILSKLLDRYSRIISTVPGTPIPFIILPLVPSMLGFAVMRSISDARGGILAGHIFLTMLIFIVALGVIPPL